MPDINKPMDIPELNLQPPITGKVKLSPDMQQTLAMLCAVGNSQRTLLQASESGILHTGQPTIKDIVIVHTNSDTGKGHGDNITCSQVMIMGHPDNTGNAWVRPYKECDELHKWPLGAKEVVGFSVTNLKQLYFQCDVGGEKIIIAYTR